MKAVGGKIEEGRQAYVNGVIGKIPNVFPELDTLSHRRAVPRNLTLHPLFPSPMGHVEWLCNLEEVLGKGVSRFTAFPLKFIGGSGSPCRAVAELP